MMLYIAATANLPILIIKNKIDNKLSREMNKHYVCMHAHTYINKLIRLLILAELVRFARTKIEIVE